MLVDAVTDPDDVDADARDGDGESDCDGADDGGDAVDDDGDGDGYQYVKAGRVASRPGYPAEPAARSRPFGRVSLAPPFASLIPRFAWPAARCAPRRVPDRHGRSHVRRHRQRHRRVLLATALRAALVAELASLALAGCAGYGQRLGSTPPHSVRRRCRLRRAPPVPASPCAAPCNRARTSADTSVRASGSALRATALGRVGLQDRSSATAAPTCRLRRRRFPHRSDCTSCRSRRPGAAWFSHPTHL